MFFSGFKDHLIKVIVIITFLSKSEKNTALIIKTMQNDKRMRLYCCVFPVLSQSLMSLDT